MVVFSKIYQQNQIIKLQYEKQRLERSHTALVKKRNALLVSLSQAKDYAYLKQQAESHFGMKLLALDHLVTFTEVVS
jgi:hypothetical protein